VTDLGDAAQMAYGRRATLRLDPRLFGEFGLPDPPMPSDEASAETDLERRLNDWLAAAASANIGDWLAKAVKQLRSRRFVRVVEHEGDQSYFVLLQKSVDAATLDDIGDSPSLTSTGVKLRDHLQGVGVKAAEFGVALGLSQDIVDDLRLAGELHDLGKIDSRFQAQMHGHDRVRIALSEASGETLAKSLPYARTKPDAWPPVRHEVSSVALAQSASNLVAQAHDSDLVLHLIGSHHGYARPLPALRRDGCPQRLRVVGEFRDGSFSLVATCDSGNDVSNTAVVLETESDLADTTLALDMSERFWRLQERYGHHGLAWLEAIFRLADQQRSAEEAQ